MDVDYYELLGLSPSASTDAVRNAYKEKAMKHHPDRGGSAPLWAQIQKAYDTLSDLQRRAVYDRTKADAEGGAERQFAQKFGEGTFDLSESLLVDALRACAVQGHQEAQAARLWQLLVEGAQPGSPGVRAYNVDDLKQVVAAFE